MEHFVTVPFRFSLPSCLESFHRLDRGIGKGATAVKTDMRVVGRMVGVYFSSLKSLGAAH